MSQNLYPRWLEKYVQWNKLRAKSTSYKLAQRKTDQHHTYNSDNYMLTHTCTVSSLACKMIKELSSTWKQSTTCRASYHFLLCVTFTMVLQLVFRLHHSITTYNKKVGFHLVTLHRITTYTVDTARAGVLSVCYVFGKNVWFVLAETWGKPHIWFRKPQPSQMPTLGIEPGMQQWKASALPTKLAGHPQYISGIWKIN